MSECEVLAFLCGDRYERAADDILRRARYASNGDGSSTIKIRRKNGSAGKNAAAAAGFDHDGGHDGDHDGGLALNGVVLRLCVLLLLSPSSFVLGGQECSTQYSVGGQ